MGNRGSAASALDGADREPRNKVLLDEGVDRDDGRGRDHDAGHLDALGKGGDVVLLQVAGHHRLARGLDDAAQHQLQGPLLKALDEEHAVVPLVPALHAVVEGKGDKDRHRERQQYAKEDRKVARPVDAGALLQLRRQGLKVLPDDRHVHDGDAGGQDHGKDVVDQLQVLDQQVERNQAAGKVHRKDDHREEELPPREALGKAVGQGHGQQHIVEHADQRDEDRHLHAVEDGAVFKDDEVGFQRQVLRIEHEAGLDVVGLGDQGDADGVVERIEYDQREQPEKCHDGVVHGVQALQTAPVLWSLQCLARHAAPSFT